MNSIITNIITYSKFILKELIAYRTYLNAFIIGASINLMSGNNFPGALAPYIVPVIVQAFSKSSVGYVQE